MSQMGYIPPAGNAYAANLNAMYGGPVALGANCIQHKNVPAFTRCHSCGGAMCATCAFAYPGGVYICPPCATNPVPRISDKRKRLVYWAVGLACWTILGTIGVFFLIKSNAGDRSAVTGWAVAGQYLVFEPAIVGMGVGIACFERRMKTPGMAWFGLVGNGVIVLLWLLVEVIGIMSR